MGYESGIRLDWPLGHRYKVSCRLGATSAQPLELEWVPELATVWARMTETDLEIGWVPALVIGWVPELGIE